MAPKIIVAEKSNEIFSIAHLVSRSANKSRSIPVDSVYIQGQCSAEKASRHYYYNNISIPLWAATIHMSISLILRSIYALVLI
jgi:hypothetical protein